MIRCCHSGTGSGGSRLLVRALGEVGGNSE